MAGTIKEANTVQCLASTALFRYFKSISQLSVFHEYVALVR